jgi:hypothetical protein
MDSHAERCVLKLYVNRQNCDFPRNENRSLWILCERRRATTTRIFLWRPSSTTTSSTLPRRLRRMGSGCICMWQAEIRETYVPLGKITLYILLSVVSLEHMVLTAGYSPLYAGLLYVFVKIFRCARKMLNEISYRSHELKDIHVLLKIHGSRICIDEGVGYGAT